MEFLRTFRLEHAATLLLNSAVPIKIIGAKVGYRSRTSFSHAFQHSFGLSPVTFRASQVRHTPTDIHAVSERLRTLSGPSQDLAWEVDLSRGAVWWSEGTFFALGYTAPTNIISDVARFYDRVHPEDRDRVVQSVQAACLSRSLVWQGDFRFKRADSTYARISNGSVILRDGNGAARRLIGVMQVLDMPSRALNVEQMGRENRSAIPALTAPS